MHIQFCEFQIIKFYVPISVLVMKATNNDSKKMKTRARDVAQQ
jgi:hypothetical protein